MSRLFEQSEFLLISPYAQILVLEVQQVNFAYLGFASHSDLQFFLFLCLSFMGKKKKVNSCN